MYEEGKPRSQDRGEHGEDDQENRREVGEIRKEKGENTREKGESIKEGENMRGDGENAREEGGNTVFLPISLTHTCFLIKHINELLNTMVCDCKCTYNIFG